MEINGALHATDSVFDTATQKFYPVKFAKIATTGTGDNTLVAAVTGKKIRVLALYANAAGAVNFKFQSGASGTDLTGLFYCPSAGVGGGALGFNPLGWFETAAAALLNANLSGNVVVGGMLAYCEVG